MTGGFIKLHRCALDSWLWQMPAEQFKVALTVLVSANWRDGVTVSGGRRVDVPRGSLVTTLDDLAAKSGVSVRTCRTALQNLAKLEFLTSTSTNRFRVISVMNYDSYQARDEETDKQSVRQASPKRQASDKQVTSNRQARYKEEEREEEKEVQEGKKSIPSAAADRSPSQSGLFAESDQEARESSVVHRDTGEDANAAPAPDGEPSERVVEWGRELRDVIAEDSSRRAWGRELAARRKRIGITADELAKYLSVSGRRLTAWEKGTAVPGLEEGAQCLERLGDIERAIGELAGAAIDALNHVANARYKSTSQNACDFALLAWRRSWDEPRVRQIVDQRCSEVAGLEGGKYLRPDVVFRKAKVLAIAEQLDAGAVPHNERQPLKGAAFLDRIDEEIAAMRREDEQRRQLL